MNEKLESKVSFLVFVVIFFFVVGGRGRCSNIIGIYVNLGTDQCSGERQKEEILILKKHRAAKKW